MNTATQSATVNPLVKGDTLHIEGRRWFQTTYGNTYHSTRVYVNGKEVAHIPYCYGYGDQYIYTGAAELAEMGYLPGYTNSMAFWRYCEEKGIALSNSVVDVKRKRDL